MEIGRLAACRDGHMRFFEYSFCLQFMHFLPVYSLCPLWFILLPVPFNSSVFAIIVSVSVYWITVSCVSFSGWCCYHCTSPIFLKCFAITVTVCLYWITVCVVPHFVCAVTMLTSSKSCFSLVLSKVHFVYFFQSETV